jgi:hypothetical protein
MARDLVFQGVNVLGQDELKFTYKRLYTSTKFSGRFAPEQPHRRRGMRGKTREGEGKGEE